MGYMWGSLAGGGRGDCGFVAVVGVGVEEDVGGGRWEEGVGGSVVEGGGGRSLKGMNRVSMGRRWGDWGREELR